MNDPIIEIVTFKLADGVSEAAFLETVPASNDYIKTCPGFLARRLSKSADGTWYDHLEWASLEAAYAAARGFETEPRLAPFVQAIDFTSTKMHHNVLHARLP